ncbi:DUF1127 domain-containing protein [Pararhizobium sp.]|uniref:DUF1127 domain-containing protein n=1 Tax=Pararhizobium sp. TaxID=1977563 RepID=UPI002725FA19|nr:DUF1127 domain-containing protein [Pararhizobium sp.]MDO9417119.1 DUF1127 domain-containing protein [Pararhizobium sp.]
MGTIDTMSAIARSAACDPAEPPRLRPGFWLVRLWYWFDGRTDKARSRYALSELTDDQLRDIGVSRRDAQREATQSFWN